MSIAQTEKRVMREPLGELDWDNLARIVADPFARLSAYAGDRLWFAGLAYWDKEKGNRAVLTRKGWAAHQRRLQKERG